jgi:hypothetical protein
MPIAILADPTALTVYKELSAMLFINNKYTKWYNNIILRAQNRPNLTTNTEKHHIIPRSLGGNNSKSNIAVLTTQEHFLCHLLLTKMVVGQAHFKMCKALTMMIGITNIGRGRYVANSRWYSYARKQNKQNIDAYWTDERRKERSEQSKLTSLGRKHSEETKLKMRNKTWTDKALDTRLSNCLKAAAARKGKPYSAKAKKSRKDTYLNKNLEIATHVIKLSDQGFNNRQISLTLGITWDRVKLALIHRVDFEKIGKK